MISFDAETVIKSVSYYVQQMFAINKGDTILPVTPTRAPPVYYVASQNDGAVFIKVSLRPDYSPLHAELTPFKGCQYWVR